MFPADSTIINEGSSLPLDTGETILNYYALHLIVIKGRAIITSEGSKFMPVLDGYKNWFLMKSGAHDKVRLNS